MRKRSLLIDDLRCPLSGGKRDSYGCCRSDHYMGGGAKSTSGVRNVCGRMDVRDLKSRAEKQ